MSWTCVICYEPLLHSHTICAVNCGHVFHEGCIEKWITSSKSCPQCRKKCLVKDVLKLFFNQGNIDDTRENVAELMSTLENANLQLSEKIKIVSDNEVKIKKLKSNLKYIKNENESLKSISKMLLEKEEMNKAQLLEVTTLRNENDKLSTKVAELHKVEKVLKGTAEDVEKLVFNETDLYQMATFQVTLKRALVETQQKKDSLQRMCISQKSQLEWTEKLLAEIRMSKSKLEDEIHGMEIEIKHLKKNYQWKRKETDTAVSVSATNAEAVLAQDKRLSPLAIEEEEDNIFDRAFIQSVENKDSDNRKRVSQTSTRDMLPPKVTARSSSPYHHLVHGSISSLKRAKTKEMEKLLLKTTPQSSLNGLRLQNGTGKRSLQSTRPTYQTSKLLKGDLRFNFTLSPPHSAPYQPINFDAPHASHALRKSPSKVPRISAKLAKRPQTADTASAQNIKKFLSKC